MNENKTPEMLTVKEIAEKFVISEGFIKKKIKEGAFPVEKNGNKTYINAEEFGKYLSTSTIDTIK